LIREFSPKATEIMTTAILPEALQHLSGRIVDVDTHEMMPAQVWVEEFGDVDQSFVDAFLHDETLGSPSPNNPNQPKYAGDSMAIGEDIWTVKGPLAPGAVNPERRLAVMDLMGIDRQLMFPTSVALYGMGLMLYPAEYGFLRRFTGDRRETGRALCHAYNQWIARRAVFSDRVRPVAVLYGDTPEELMSVTKSVIASGVKAVMLMSSVLPGGQSPASDLLDPFWKMLTDAGVVVTLHIGAEGGFLKTDRWRDAPAFEGYRVHAELNFDPWRLSIGSWPAENFITSMVLGGVFERHPKLRLGAIELGAFWIGPMVEKLDHIHAMKSAAIGPGVYRLPEKPSDYIRRHLSITPMVGEPVDRYIQRYGMEEIYCFSSDYPHIEGGRNPVETFYNSVKDLGPDMVEKFFVSNGARLLAA
jgi:predicted TIM-barrel fold metal-dependent hydrolase